MCGCCLQEHTSMFLKQTVDVLDVSGQDLSETTSPKLGVLGFNGCKIILVVLCWISMSSPTQTDIVSVCCTGYYGKGNEYNVLVGRDSTVAIAKMSLNPADLALKNDVVSSAQMCLGIHSHLVRLI